MGEDKQVDLDLEKKEEPVANEDGSVSIAIEEESPVASEQVEEPAREPEGAKEPEHISNSEAAKRRLDWEKQSLRRENERLARELAESKKTTAKAPEDLETELSKKPVSTIEAMIEKKANEIVDRRLSENSYQSHFNKVLEDSKAKVIKKHSELEDASSVKSQVMMEVLERNPHLTSNPHGPLIAMIEMEEELERRGFAKKEEPAKKIPAASLPNSRNIPEKKGTITLTREDMEFCKERNLDPKRYAQTKYKLSKNPKGVEV